MAAPAPFNVLFHSTADPARRWQQPLGAALAGENLFWSPDEIAPELIDVVLTAAPPPGAFAAMPRLRLVQSLWMGVESLVDDATIPAAIPLARMIDPHMTRAMVESVAAHVMGLHLRLDDFARAQREARWQQRHNPLASDRRVGILGLGELGQAAARAVRALGFQVAGWSRSPKTVDGIECFAGAVQLPDFLSRTDILVALLPLTADTRGLIDARFLLQLPEGATFVNLARGALVKDGDLLAALGSARLRHAVLDVFNEEPLPPDHPYWHHERVTVTPHSAALSNPRTAAAFIAENIRRLRAGEPLCGRVDRTRGY